MTTDMTGEMAAQVAAERPAGDAQGSPAPLRVGYKASAEQFSPRELVDLAVAAEEHGLDSVWVSDHFQPWRDTGGHAPSSLAFLGAAAASTKRVVLGTSVLTPTLRYNPAVLAQYFATLACLAPQRVVLGVGTGEAMNEHAVSGQAFPAFKERSARLRESIEVMRRLWSGERVSHSGEHYTTVDAKLYDLPEQQVPIHIAAGGPVMAKWAGRLGDGLICTSGKGMGLYVDDLLPAAAAGLEASEAPQRPYERVIEIKISYDRDPAAAVAATRFWAPLSLTAEQKHGLADAREIERAADALPDEQVAKRWIIASDPESALQQIRPYVEAGLTHLVVHAPGHDQARFLDHFTQDVLAPLRELQASTTGRTSVPTSTPTSAPASVPTPATAGA